MTALSIKRVLAVPSLPADPSTLYFVKSGDPGLLEIYVSNNDGTELRHVLNKGEVAAMVAAANSSTATKLATARNIDLTGDASGSTSFDGSANVEIAVTLADTGVTAGQYTKVTVDSKGRVTAGDGLLVSDIPALPGSKITSDLSVNTSGNAATATALQTARTINGVAFDGTQNIVINAVDSTPRIAVTQKGQAGGVATLDGNGLVPANQLPSYVDDILEFADLASFPISGESGKIYVAADTNATYRWTGTQYVNIPSGVGLADAAIKLNTARNISIGGDASWNIDFDGTTNVGADLTLAYTGVSAGTYTKVKVDAKGRVTNGYALVQADIPTLDYTTVTSAASVELAAAEW
jgi:phage-related tail fiber protein